MAYVGEPLDHRARPLLGAPVRIVVVGGGCAGVLATIALLHHAGSPLDVVIVEPASRLGEGVAYSTRDGRHRLNVPAEKLGARIDAVDGFLHWARQRDPTIASGDFLARADFAAYLRDALDAATRQAPADSSVRHAEATARSVRRDGAAGPERVELDDGSSLMADRVVLALGIQPGPPLPALADSRAFHSPWEPGALAPLPDDATVLLVGTGLTAIDAVLSLTGDSPTARVVATSRSGLVPHAHLPSGSGHAVPPPTWPDGALDVDLLATTFRLFCRDVEAGGGDWRDAVDALRPQLQGLWRRLPVEEQGRFLRTGARWWDVRRHRMAPAVGEQVARLLATGRLRVHAGTVEAVESHGVRRRVTLDGAEGPMVLAVDRIIACTGFGADVAASPDPLLVQLLADGRAAPDPLGIGLRSTREDGSLLDRGGRHASTIHLLGALRRGELWESTAVPELRAQADALARTIVAPVFS